ncbi:Uncharacterized protein PBTT_07325 [Plasmodiophora brassicae]|uniref:Uncharacterized protein n=1 Tax=Plasmodiophora brassicae TaxID=37360 RepID=A0A0G4J257_PLABS|nr:hypothetical protein PBRA_008557 [Plasmodiophora brassicae]
MYRVSQAVCRRWARTAAAPGPDVTRPTGCFTPLSKEFMRRIRRSGASVDKKGKVHTEAFYNVILMQGSGPHSEYVSACSLHDDKGSAPEGDPIAPDPVVHILAPSRRDGAIPSPEDQDRILMEAGSVVIAYAVLRPDSFAECPEPDLGPPTRLPDTGVSYRHSSVSARWLPERISSGRGLPTIGSQPSGTTLCSIVYSYANAMFGMKLVKT